MEGTQDPTLIAPKHQPGKDPTLLTSSIKKRLRFRASDSAYVLSDQDILLGGILYASWCAVFGYDPNFVHPFDPCLFADCINDNEFHQLSSKTKATIAANAERSDPTWRHSVVRIFSKAQHKVNENSLFTGWKACQTLALAHDAVILFLGPVKKYQRIIRDRKSHDHIFIYAGHTPAQLGEWARSFCKPSMTHTCNDYSAFDQSQGGEAVVFEIKKMQRLSIPSFLIDYHFYLKTNISCQFGPLTSMRLTGEPGTYDDNTDYNLAVLASRYDLLSGPTAVAVSGDDSDICGVPAENPIWKVVEPMLLLTFKLEFTKQPLFCGFFLNEHGALRAPRALFAKIYVAHNDGSISEKIASYTSEFAVGHSLGDVLWTLIPLEDHIYQAAVFDYICRFAPKDVKSMLRIGFSDIDFSLFSQFSDFFWFQVPTWVRRVLRSQGQVISTRFSDETIFQGISPA
nr:MAG: RNA-dependent RNA polymerase [Tymovirales sp.]